MGQSPLQKIYNEKAEDKNFNPPPMLTLKEIIQIEQQADSVKLKRVQYTNRQPV